MRKLFPIAATLISICATSTGALAQVVYYPPPAVAPVVTAPEAEAIAAANGIVAIRRLRLDEGLWKIEGRDTYGRKVNLKIDRATGAIVQLYRDNWW